jgi:hypothetical protein
MGHGPSRASWAREKGPVLLSLHVTHFETAPAGRWQNTMGGTPEH